MIATRIASAGIANFKEFMSLTPRQVNWFLRSIARLGAENDLRMVHALTAANPQLEKRQREQMIDRMHKLARGERVGGGGGKVITDLTAMAEFVRSLPHS